MFTTGTGTAIGFGAFGYGVVIINACNPHMRASGVSAVARRGYNVLRRWNRDNCTILLVRKLSSKVIK